MKEQKRKSSGSVPVTKEVSDSIVKYYGNKHQLTGRGAIMSRFSGAIEQGLDIEGIITRCGGDLELASQIAQFAVRVDEENWEEFLADDWTKYHAEHIRMAWVSIREFPGHSDHSTPVWQAYQKYLKYPETYSPRHMRYLAMCELHEADLGPYLDNIEKYTGQACMALAEYAIAVKRKRGQGRNGRPLSELYDLVGDMYELASGHIDAIISVFGLGFDVSRLAKKDPDVYRLASCIDIHSTFKTLSEEAIKRYLASDDDPSTVVREIEMRAIGCKRLPGDLTTRQLATLAHVRRLNFDTDTISWMAKHLDINVIRNITDTLGDSVYETVRSSPVFVEYNGNGPTPIKEVGSAYAGYGIGSAKGRRLLMRTVIEKYGVDEETPLTDEEREKLIQYRVALDDIYDPGTYRLLIIAAEKNPRLIHNVCRFWALRNPRIEPLVVMLYLTGFEFNWVPPNVSPYDLYIVFDFIAQGLDPKDIDPDIFMLKTLDIFEKLFKQVHGIVKPEWLDMKDHYDPTARGVFVRAMWATKEGHNVARLYAPDITSRSVKIPGMKRIIYPVKWQHLFASAVILELQRMGMDIHDYSIQTLYPVYDFLRAVMRGILKEVAAGRSWSEVADLTLFDFLTPAETNLYLSTVSDEVLQQLPETGSLLIYLGGATGLSMPGYL